jgi:drug/metabolite transporter (DMT)-like permease
MKGSHPALAIFLILGGCFMITLNDAFNKLLTDHITIAQIIFAKNALVAAVLVAVAPAIGAWRVFSLADWKGQFTRGALMVVNSFLFLLGLAALPLSNCVMLSFVGPLFTTALAALILGERVGIHRWTAVCVGFVGVVIVSWPSSDGFSWAVLYPLAAALCGALRDLLTRRMANRITSESMIFYSVLAMALAGGAAAKADLVTIGQSDWMMLTVSAAASLVALYMQAEAFRYAEAATIAPFRYSNLVWVTMFDVLLWRHFPSWNVFVGAIVIIGAMLYIYRRTKKVTVTPAEGAPET